MAARSAPAKYEVHATVWVSRRSPAERNYGPMRGGEVLSTESWPELVRSFAILDGVATRLHLYVLPDAPADLAAFSGFSPAEVGFRTGRYKLVVDAAARYVLASGKDSVIERGVVGDSIGRSRGFLWAPTAAQLGSPRTIAFTLVAPREAATWLRDQLYADLPPQGSLMQVGLTGGDPARAAATLNAVVQDFVAEAAQLRKRSLVETTRAVELQLRYAAADLQDAESALERFGSENITLPSAAERGVAPSPNAPGVDAYFRERTVLDSLVQERQRLTRMVDDAATGAVDVESFWAIIPASPSQPPELAAALAEYSTKRSALRAAQQVYTEEHQRVRELHGTLRQLGGVVIPQLLRAQIAELRQREAEIETRTGRLSRELRNIPLRAMEEARLRRTVESRSTLYTALRGRYEEARLSEASALPEVSVLDTAVPPEFPITNVRPRIAGGVFVVFVGLALALVLVLDRFDRRFRHLSHATRDLGLHVMGTVPRIARGREGARAVMQTAQTIESFRAIRVALRYAVPFDQPMVVTVTSPGPGEGKSLVASNIALSFADAGHRTLLIDGDVRRGGLHEAFGVDRRPGLVDLLRGEVQLEDVLRPTANANLTLMPSGKRDRRAPELLAGSELTDLLVKLEERYEAIVVDSAPLAAGIDPYVLSMATGAVFIVLRTEVTDRRMARATIDTLMRFRTQVLGAVVNDVRHASAFKYYSYLPGYGSPIDEEEQVLIGTGPSESGGRKRS